MRAQVPGGTSASEALPASQESRVAESVGYEC